MTKVLHLSPEFETYINELISNRVLYSENEIIIGKTSSGDSIYEKVISVAGQTGDQNNRQIAHNIGNLKTVLWSSAKAGNSSIVFPNNGKTYTLEINKIDSDYIYANVSGAFGGWRLEFTLVYLKNE